MRQTGNATRQPAVLVAILLTMVLATGGCSIRGASSSAVPVSTIAPTQGQTEAVQPPLPASPTPGAARSSVPAIRRPKQGWEPDWRVQQTPAATVPARSMQGGSDITAVGDSIMVDALPNLRSLFPGIAVDAVAGRQVATGLEIMQSLASQGRLAANVVIELGTNGTFTSAQLDRFLSLAGDRRVVLLTNHCGYCGWVPSNNDLMAATCTADRACTVADWEALAKGHPGWFATDGVHMAIGGSGGQAFAELIASRLGRRIPGPQPDPTASGDVLPGRPFRAGQAR